jgi:hypothetical protein
MRVEKVLEKLSGVRKTARGQWSALCPAHEDSTPSLSVATGNDGRILVNCKAGCTPEEICAASGLKMKDLFPGGGGAKLSPKTTATVQHAEIQGCRLADYASAKKLSASFLVGIGLSEIPFGGKPALRIPYKDETGREVAVRFRTALAGDDRFRWKKGAKPALYGLWRLESARKAGYVVIVEGESDCHSLWHRGIPALGLPGAGNWKDERDAAAFAGISDIYIFIESDRGGETVLKWLAKSSIRERVRLVRLSHYKDPSELHVADSANFKSHWQAALKSAERWTDRDAAEATKKKETAWAQCRTLASDTGILNQFAADVRRRGLVGEVKVAKVLYLALISRLLDRPVSIAVKGPSSGGKSFLAKCVLEFFPPSAFYALSAMSERALAYSEEPLKHRFLVIYEAAGMQGDLASYLLRSLLSEGCVRYEMVDKTKDGMKARLIHRDGPTGLLLTTTALALHPENETRIFSLNVTDTCEQTRSVLVEMTRENRQAVDFGIWHALQSWLESAEHRVTIPYAESLAGAVPTVAIRLRRDFGAVLSLIRAHAILYQATRKKNAEGKIIATFDDYAVVRDLLAESLAEGVEQAVSKTIRETVQAVAKIAPRQSKKINTTALGAVAKELKLDKSAASRRVRDAIKQGYLKNQEERRGRPMILSLGNPLPDNVEVLPSVESLRQCCTVAGGTARVIPPPTPTGNIRNDSPPKFRFLRKV